MKKLFAQDLLEKHSCKEDSYFKENEFPYSEKWKEEKAQEDEEWMCKLQGRFGDRVPKGWYGFGGLGVPTPLVWYKLIYEFLEWVEKECPDFEIHQQKIKMGSYRCHLGNINEKVQENIKILELGLFDQKLIY